MPGRIRSIKPEILDDEVTAALPHLEWRLFVSLWLMADDYGNLRGVSAQIKGAALWGSDDSLASVTAALDRLEGDELIRRYTVRGQSYIAICGWAKHQKVDKPGKPHVPGPDESDATPSRESRESLARVGRGPREGLAPDLDQDQRPTIRDRERDPRARDARTPPTPDLSRLVDHAVDALNAHRQAVEPGCRPIDEFGDQPGRAKLVAILRALPADQRMPKLDHALSMLGAEARLKGTTGILRLGMLAGDASWPRAQAETVASIERAARGRDGPAGRPTTPARGSSAGRALVARLEAEEAARSQEPQ